MNNQDSSADKIAVRNKEGIKAMESGAMAVALGQAGKTNSESKLTESPTNLPLPVEPAQPVTITAIKAGTPPTK